MKTYEIEYDGSAGRVWNVIQIGNRMRTVIASRCKSEDAYRVIEKLRADDAADARKMELESALFAIVDRIQGGFDSPYLKPWGQLTTVSDDVLRIATTTLKGTRR